MISVPSTLAFELLDITISTFLISLFWVLNKFKKHYNYIIIVNLRLPSLMNQNHHCFSAILLVEVDVLSVMNKSQN